MFEQIAMTISPDTNTENISQRNKSQTAVLVSYAQLNLLWIVTGYNKKWQQNGVAAF